MVPQPQTRSRSHHVHNGAAADCKDKDMHAGIFLVIFDPHCRYIPGITSSNPGKRINFVDSPAAAEHPDQFAPYKVFGCDTRSFFHGTLFRFPLRTEAHAQTSRISKQVSALLCVSCTPLIDAAQA